MLKDCIKKYGQGTTITTTESNQRTEENNDAKNTEKHSSEE